MTAREKIDLFYQEIVYGIQDDYQKVHYISQFSDLHPNKVIRQPIDMQIGLGINHMVDSQIARMINVGQVPLA